MAYRKPPSSRRSAGLAGSSSDSRRVYRRRNRPYAVLARLIGDSTRGQAELLPERYLSVSEAERRMRASFSRAERAYVKAHRELGLSVEDLGGLENLPHYSVIAIVRVEVDLI